LEKNAHGAGEKNPGKSKLTNCAVFPVINDTTVILKLVKASVNKSESFRMPGEGDSSDLKGK
jgi:hypothetical protein